MRISDQTAETLFDMFLDRWHPDHVCDIFEIRPSPEAFDFIREVQRLHLEGIGAGRNLRGFDFYMGHYGEAWVERYKRAQREFVARFVEDLNAALPKVQALLRRVRAQNHAA